MNIYRKEITIIPNTVEGKGIFDLLHAEMEEYATSINVEEDTQNITVTCEYILPVEWLLDNGVIIE